MTYEIPRNVKGLSIVLGLGALAIAVLTVVPAATFAVTDYSNVIFGTKTVSEWIAQMDEDKDTSLTQVNYVSADPSAKSMHIGTQTVEQIIHDLIAYKNSDKTAWLSHISVLPGGEFFDPGASLQSVAFYKPVTNGFGTISFEK